MGSECYVEGIADPNAVLYIYFQNDVYTVYTDEYGTFSWQLDTSKLVNGINDFEIMYAEVDGVPVNDSSVTQASIMCDLEAPIVTTNTDRLYQGEREIGVTVDGEEYGWKLWMTVDGVNVFTSGYITEVGEYVITIPDDVVLKEGSSIIVGADDVPGNSSSVNIQYIEIDSITISDYGSTEAGRLGSDDKLLFSLNAEPESEIVLKGSSGREYTAYVSDDGSVTIRTNPKALLDEGVNTVDIYYAASTGYPEHVIDSTRTEIEVVFDSSKPEVKVDTDRISRDTTAITVTVSNEIYGYGIELITLDGWSIWSIDNVVDEKTITIDIDGAEIKSHGGLSVNVTDYINNTTEVILPYDDSDALMEAYAYSGNTDMGTFRAGDTAEADIWLVCSAEDMNDGYVQTWLVDENEKRTLCKLFYSEGDKSDRASVLNEYGVNVSNIADRVYFIKGIIIPENQPAGTYRVVIDVETVNDEYSYNVGTLEVESQEIGNKVSEPYVLVAENYAIGFDEPLQTEFRQDSVVLTGWVIVAPGQTAYFDRYEIENSNGRSVTGYISTELVQYDRVDVVDKVAMLPNAEPTKAGFVLTLDLSNFNLNDGEQYVLKLYSSYQIDTELENETISATICINDNADPILPELIDEIVLLWTPVEETPEPDGNMQ